MGDFGADTARYANHHPWAARLDREADIGVRRSDHDMRLAVFNYPLAGWSDAVVMNLLMGRAVGVQLEELARVSYQPLAEAFRAVAPVEARHVALAEEGLDRLMATGGREPLQASVDYWWPRVAASFGVTESKKFDSLRAMGLRHETNADLRTRWDTETARALDDLGLASGRS
jgi:1,2-phenylacetyl-CoA epoxidase catalytic subunit